MNDRALRPHVKLAPKIHPRCEAKLSAEAARWRKSGNSSSGYYNGEPYDQCHTQSQYVIDEKYFCRKHAAFYLLDREFPPPEAQHDE